jgi:hypothetical protein
LKSSLRFLVSGSASALLALGCMMLFEHLGSGVDTHGVLHEPFFLIPAAWMFFATAIYFGVRYWRAQGAAKQNLNESKK